MVQTKIGLSWWPSDQASFFVIAEEVNSFMIIQHHRWNVNICIYKSFESSFIVHLSISVAIFESWRLFQSSTIEQISLFGWHQESHPPTHASHPDNQDNGRAFVFRSFSSRNFDQFVALLFHGLIPNQMEIWNYLLPALALWMWVWYPLKWGFKAIQNGNEFQNGFAYCGPDFKCLLLLLPCSHLANDSHCYRLDCLFEAHMETTFILPTACINWLVTWQGRRKTKMSMRALPKLSSM